LGCKEGEHPHHRPKEDDMAAKVEEKVAKVKAPEKKVDHGYGECLDCKVPYEKHCNKCDGPWCPVCDDW
jgi:hypothetical protein